MSKLAMVIQSREKDLGGFSVRRLLPYATHRMVGPFIFFDHMGPASFAPGQGMDVRPHPHIHLSTVTYLFEGKIRHRDSLGSDRLIEPGAINWMTAGHGIVHSERSPDDVRKNGGRLNGIQLWVAMPAEKENIEPSFVHHPASTLPEFEIEGVKLKLLVGDAFGRSSPARPSSDLCYLDAHFPKGSRLRLPANGRELAFYLVSGGIRSGGQDLRPLSLGVAENGHDLELEALEESRVMLFGGMALGKRVIDWNFVSSSQESVEQAKADWRKGPGNTKRFPLVPGDDQEFIPLPPEPTAARKGTPL